LINRKSDGDRGSAILEFVIFALPLFIPTVFFLLAINGSSRGQLNAENLSRQLARAYVTSPSSDFTAARMSAVMDIFSKNVFGPDRSSISPMVFVSCSATPCLTPNARVQVEVRIVGDSHSFTASSTEIVDAWRSG
jgi:Flp pilus assembly protein TadG